MYPSHALLDEKPLCAKRLLLHSSALESEGAITLQQRCEKLGIRSEIADTALSRISRKENCYAAIVFEKYTDTLSDRERHIVLHQPSDMGNLGTILRVCLGFSFADIALIRPAADSFDPRVVRASMGALFSTRVRYFDTFEAYRDEYPAHHLYPFMLDGMPLHQMREIPNEPYALLFGNEAAGLSASFLQVGQPLRIVHSERIDSLNLANAVSIGVYAFAVLSSC